MSPKATQRQPEDVYLGRSLIIPLSEYYTDSTQTKIEDLVQITPEDFNKTGSNAIEDNINAKYANKVLPNHTYNSLLMLTKSKVIQKIGLCICLYDLLSSSEGLIGHGTGLVNVNVTFRLIVFRPFRHEVLHGRITSSSGDGIMLRTTFFSDIFVPAQYLPQPSHFDQSEGCFVYQHPDMEEGMHFDNYEIARFRIESEDWFDQAPDKPQQGGEEMDEEEKRATRISPWRITASMADDGLGPCFWWDDEPAEEEPMEE